MQDNLPSLTEGLTFSPNEAAERSIRDYCGWHVSPVLVETITLDHLGGNRVMLPSKRVLEVIEVAYKGEMLDPESDYSWSQDGWITFNRSIPAGDRVFEVMLEHGYSPSQSIAQVIQGVVTRARMSPAGNVVQQRAGTQSVTYASSGGQVAGFPLLESEKSLLAPYKLNWGLN